MKNVLIIAYYFPPMGLSGVQRTLKFAKYLPQFGWEPTVLTVAPTGYFAQDLHLLDEAEKAQIKIERTNSLDVNRLLAVKGTVKMPPEWLRNILNKISQVFFIPDNKIGWKSKAIRKAEELIEAKEYSAIFATAPPYTDFLIGRYLREKYNIPLVIDYRDAWIDNPYHFYITPLHKLAHKRMEKKVLRSADRVVVINRRIKELLLNRYNFLEYNDVEILPQGYDPADFDEAKKIRIPSSKKMRITYSGTLYRDRTPKYFLEALAKVFQDYPEVRGSIEACFVGNFRDENKKLMHQLGLDHDVKIVGYLPHIECTSYLLSSDVLWMMVAKGTGSDMMSTGKLFEYLGSGKTILGCVPPGVASTTILEAGGIVAEPNNVNEIAAAILQCYRRYKKNALKGPDKDVVERYNRKNITGELAKLMELLVDYSHQIEKV